MKEWQACCKGMRVKTSADKKRADTSWRSRETRTSLVCEGEWRDGVNAGAERRRGREAGRREARV